MNEYIFFFSFFFSLRGYKGPKMAYKRDFIALGFEYWVWPSGSTGLGRLGGAGWAGQAGQAGQAG